MYSLNSRASLKTVQAYFMFNSLVSLNIDDSSSIDFGQNINKLNFQ